MTRESQIIEQTHKSLYDLRGARVHECTDVTQEGIVVSIWFKWEGKSYKTGFRSYFDGPREVGESTYSIWRMESLKTLARIWKDLQNENVR